MQPMQWFWCILGFQVSWHFQPVLDKCGQIPRMQKDSFRISGSFGNFEFCDVSSKTPAPRVPSLPAPAMKLFWQGRCPECLGATDVLWVPTSIRCPVRSVPSLGNVEVFAAGRYIQGMQSQMHQMPPLLISRLPRHSFQETSHDTKQALQVWLWKKNQAINRKMEILWRKDEFKIRKTLSSSGNLFFGIS